MQLAITRTTMLPNELLPHSLTINGRPVIQWCRQPGLLEGNLFLEEDMFFIVKEGHFNFQYGNHVYTVTKNQLAFFKKDILIQYKTAFPGSGDGGVAFYLVSLHKDVVTEYMKSVTMQPAGREEGSAVITSCLDQRLMQYVDSLGAYFGEEKPADSLVKIKLMELLFCLSQSDRALLDKVLDVRDHFRPNITLTVEENIMNTISLSQLARLSGRSLSSFRRDFLAIYNMPPSQWIRQKRLEKARELLLHSTMNVTTVCYTLGFENIAHFSRLFKSYFGYSPSEAKHQQQVA
jgi:AraC-like DNA-binding protein